jgi:hypothetical protein
MLYTFLNRKWFFDKVYNEWVAAPLLQVAYNDTYQNMDRGFIEFFGPQGIVSEVYNRSVDFAVMPLGFVFRRMFILLGSLTVILVLIGNWAFFVNWVELPLVVIIAGFFVTWLPTIKK